MLAHDFERYANQSKDACLLTCYANSYGEVIFPKYDAFKDSNECSDEGDDRDLCSMSKYFGDNVLPHNLFSDPLVWCKEAPISGESDRVSNSSSYELVSDSFSSSQAVTQSKFQIPDIYCSVGQSEYEFFVFPLDSMPTHFDCNIFQTGFSNQGYASLPFHGEHVVDNVPDMHH